uniref:Spindle and kinetochore associated complex subunit 3 n=1 Tax=Leptobrachium leishanense TaxID=445787 RepID=A0A8C5P8B7_9ANUR
MSLVTNFFGKLRSVAVTLEKETKKLEQVFTKEDEDYEDESPMRVLHNLHSEIKDLKRNLQSTIEKNQHTGQELNAFIKVCKVMQQRTASDIMQIKEMFENYGYTPLNSSSADGEMENGNPKSETDEQSTYDSEPDARPAVPALEKPESSWDLLRGPQLSDFGLSHYQFSSTLNLMSNTPHVKQPAEEAARPAFKDTYPVNVAKTPKCALRMEDDFTQVAHFGISDFNTNFNDDYTIALLNKKAQKSLSQPKKDTSDAHPSKSLKNLLATPSHLSHWTNYDNVDSPTPPVFLTPGLKIHKKENVLACDTEPLQSEEACGGMERSARSANLKQSLPAPSQSTLKSDANILDSPLPPSFCTPGLHVQKRRNATVAVESSKPTVQNNNNTVTPPVPAFETKWLQNDPEGKCLDITEPIPRPELTYDLYVQDVAPLLLDASKPYGKSSTKLASPTQIKDYFLETPQRPEMTISLTEDLMKYTLKPSSPPKVSVYENLLCTPTQPVMKSRTREDISQILSRFCDNKKNDSEPVWATKPAASSSQGIVSYRHKENRP